MHTIIRRSKQKFGPVFEVRQVGVFGRTRPELHNGGGLGKHAAVLVQLHGQSAAPDERRIGRGSALDGGLDYYHREGNGSGSGRCGDVRGRASRSRKQVERLASRSGQLRDVLLLDEVDG